jgi:Zn-dependent protease
MIQLLTQGQVTLFVMILFALVMSLTFHEFGHAAVAKYWGDDTAERAGRLSLNPFVHIDFVGMLMVILIGFGYARPVPTNPRNYRKPFADFWVAAAGPAMNLLLAVVAVNILAFGLHAGWEIFQQDSVRQFFLYVALINLILMLFNLIPVGPLDGHYLVERLLPPRASYQYHQWNQRYGGMLLLGLVVLSIAGVPVFAFVWRLGQNLLPWITWL